MPKFLYELTHTYASPPSGGVSLGNELVVYLSVVMIVTITLTSKVLDVLDVVGGGGGSDLPPVGMLPAKIDVDSAHMSASAIANRFMDVTPFEVEKMPRILHKKEQV